MILEKHRLNKENTILLIIDIQERLASVMESREKVTENTNILISTASEMKIPIIVTEQYPKGIGPTLKEINLTEESKIFEKISFSAFVGDIKSEIEKLNRKKVIITGMECHVCVYQTARDLIAEGYEVFVARDAVCSRTIDNHLNGLELMKNFGTVISNTESIVFDLLKVAGTPEFKTISKLIK